MKHDKWIVILIILTLLGVYFIITIQSTPELKKPEIIPFNETMHEPPQIINATSAQNITSEGAPP